MNLCIKTFPQFTHLTSDGEGVIIFDVNSSTLVELDWMSAKTIEEAELTGSLDADVFKRMESQLLAAGVGIEEIILSRDILLDLQGKGVFLSRDALSHSFRRDDVLCSGMTLNVAQSCQLKCQYCFASGGDYGYKSSALMQRNIGIQAVDFFFKIADDNSQTYSITFFGGEPLLNWSLIEELTIYAEQEAEKKGKHISFSITTNAIGVDERNAQFMSEHNFSILVSLDGNEEIHNQLRPHRLSDHNSYQETVRGIKILRKYFDTLCCRATVTSLCADTKLLETYLLEAGATSVHLLPICEDKKSYLSLDSINQEIYVDSLCYLISEVDGTTVKTVNSIMRRIRTKYNRSHSCGFSKNVLTIDTDGRIYPCHRLTANEKFFLGSIQNGIDMTMVSDLRAKASVDNIPTCRSCWLKYLCGSECPVENYTITEYIETPDPELCYRNHRLYEEAFEAHIRRLYSNSNERADTANLGNIVTDSLY